MARRAKRNSNKRDRQLLAAELSLEAGMNLLSLWETEQGKIDKTIECDNNSLQQENHEF